MILKFEGEWNPEDARCDWHRRGREVLNIAIKEFNNWQLDGCDSAIIDRLLAHFEWAKAQFRGLDTTPGEWDDVVDRMEKHVRETAERPTCPHCGR